MGKYHINNGFHALDVQRCKNLIKFLSKKLKIKFFKEKLNRYISINGEIEKERTSLKSKNKKFINFFKKKKLLTNDLNIFYKYTSSDLKK